MSHESPGYDPTRGSYKAVQAMSGHIEHLTGHRPARCPWRAFYNPIVAGVIEACVLAKENLGHVAVNDDTPAPIVDGLSVYLSAKSATRAHDDEVRAKERDKEFRANNLGAKRR